MGVAEMLAEVSGARHVCARRGYHQAVTYSSQTVGPVRAVCETCCTPIVGYPEAARG